MASIYLDKQSGNWKVKSIQGGKDKRITLRKALTGEKPRPVPEDCLKMAIKLGFGVLQSPHENVQEANVKEPKFVSFIEPSDKLIDFIDYHLSLYSREHRPGSFERTNRILTGIKRFLSLLDNPPILIQDVTSRHIYHWFEWRRVQTLKPHSKRTTQPHVIAAECTQISGLFSRAIELEKLTKNPCKNPIKALRKVYPGPDPVQETKYLNPCQRKEFLENLDKMVSLGKIPLDYADLAKVILSTGMRVSAAINLKYEWIDRYWTIKLPPEYDKAKTGYKPELSQIGQEVIKRRRKANPNEPRVFPGLNRYTSYKHLKKTWDQQSHFETYLWDCPCGYWYVATSDQFVAWTQRC